jgi:adenylyltransferase/sulfurtransferase
MLKSFFALITIMKRYDRHLMIPEIGKAGQEKLKKSKVLVVGAGGLGCPVLLYLTAAGVGTIGIADFDLVDETNLARQILFSEKDIGKEKTKAAYEKLSKINPSVAFMTYGRITEKNAENIIKDFDIVIDGTDNLATKYLLNDTCIRLGKPLVYGAVSGFNGLVSVFRGKPCYRCVQPNELNSALSCQEKGVLGTTCGVIGLVQANETIKLILGLPTIEKKLLAYDGLKMEFREIKIKANKGCRCDD